MAARPTAYRRSAHLVSFWDREGLWIYNYATGTKIPGSEIFSQLLQRLATWQTPQGVCRSWGIRDYHAVSVLLEKLADRAIVLRSNRPVPSEEAAMAAWTGWNPAAGFFHSISKQIEFVEDSPRSRRKIQSRKRAGAKAAESIRLTRALPADGFARVLLNRRTWRRFADTAIPANAIGPLLWLTAGVQKWLRMPDGGRRALTTSPSGGARHPITLHVVVRRVTGVPQGLYRYDPDRHRLVALGRGAPRSIRRYLPRQFWFERAGLVVLIGANFARTVTRYKFPRAYRAVLLEAGHVCQTFCLAATWLGLAPFCTMALADRTIEADFGLDGISSSVLYAAGVGVRPRRGLPSPPAGLKGAAIEPHRDD